jgi:hypothetical protein
MNQLNLRPADISGEVYDSPSSESSPLNTNVGSDALLGFNNRLLILAAGLY